MVDYLYLIPYPRKEEKYKHCFSLEGRHPRSRQVKLASSEACGDNPHVLTWPLIYVWRGQKGFTLGKTSDPLHQGPTIPASFDLNYTLSSSLVTFEVRSFKLRVRSCPPQQRVGLGHHLLAGLYRALTAARLNSNPQVLQWIPASLAGTVKLQNPAVLVNSLPKIGDLEKSMPHW